MVPIQHLQGSAYTGTKTGFNAIYFMSLEQARPLFLTNENGVQNCVTVNVTHRGKTNVQRLQIIIRTSHQDLSPLLATHQLNYTKSLSLSRGHTYNPPIRSTLLLVHQHGSASGMSSPKGLSSLSNHEPHFID